MTNQSGCSVPCKSFCMKACGTPNLLFGYIRKNQTVGPVRIAAHLQPIFSFAASR